MAHLVANRCHTPIGVAQDPGQVGDGGGGRRAEIAQELGGGAPCARIGMIPEADQAGGGGRRRPDRWDPDKTAS
jgi:hypothetical protein